MEEREERGDVLLFPYYRGRLLSLPRRSFCTKRVGCSYPIGTFSFVLSSLWLTLLPGLSILPCVILFPRGESRNPCLFGKAKAAGGYSFGYLFPSSSLFFRFYPNQSKSVVENEEEGRILFVPLQEKRKRKKHPRAKYKKRVETPLLFSLKISLCVFWGRKRCK